MNHATVQPDLKRVDAAVRQLVKAIGYPDWTINGLQIDTANGRIRVITTVRAVRGVEFTPLLREEPVAEEAKK